MTKDVLRILAVDPGTRHMGVAIIQGEELLYYAVKSFKEKRPAYQLLIATRDALVQLIDDYRPRVLAYEKTFYVQQKSSAMLHVQEMEIARLGRTKGLVVIGHSPQHIRKILCRDGRATKEAVAAALTQRFPQLEGYRVTNAPRRAKYWHNMFDAVAVGVVCGEEARVSESAVPLEFPA